MPWDDFGIILIPWCHFHVSFILIGGARLLGPSTSFLRKNILLMLWSHLHFWTSWKKKKKQRINTAHNCISWACICMCMLLVITFKWFLISAFWLYQAPPGTARRRKRSESRSVFGDSTPARPSPRGFGSKNWKSIKGLTQQYNRKSGSTGH